MIKETTQKIAVKTEAARPVPLTEIANLLASQVELSDMGPALAAESAIVQAIQHGCSDLYFEPTRNECRIRFRIDGLLHDVAALPKIHHERMVARLKVLSQLTVYERSLPQDGRINASEMFLDHSLRVSTLPTIDGEKLVIRIINPERIPLDLSELGMRPEVLSSLQRIVMRPQGTLLLTGPSSSGKTTTLYALLNHLLRERNRSHIVTVEDPPEYRLDGISQTQLNVDGGFDYPEALRAILRQDPNVILIGEIRDKTTARTAIQAGLTGHLVLSTIHSGSASGVFARLLDMEIEPYLVSSSVTGVLAQRLVRVNCAHCREEYLPSRELLKQYGIDAGGTRFLRGAGCEHCNGLGCEGRTVIAELCKVNEEIRELVLKKVRTQQLHEAAVKNSMTTLLQNGIEKVKLGIMTIEELQLAIAADEN